MTITELGMHYYLLLDVFLLGIFMLRKIVNPVSTKNALLCYIQQKCRPRFHSSYCFKGRLNVGDDGCSFKLWFSFLTICYVVASQSQFKITARIPSGKNIVIS